MSYDAVAFLKGLFKAPIGGDSWGQRFARPRSSAPAPNVQTASDEDAAVPPRPADWPGHISELTGPTGEHLVVQTWTDLPADWRVDFEERAAIRQYNGGQAQEHAEAEALRETIAQMIQAGWALW